MNQNNINNNQLKVLSNSVKHNNLMQTSNYHLTVNEKQFLLNLVKRMKSDSSKLQFDSREYAKLAGLPVNRIDSDKVAISLERLNGKNFWMSHRLKNGHKGERLLSWFTLIDLNEATGVFTVIFNRYLRPFLWNVKSRLNDNTRKLEE